MAYRKDLNTATSISAQDPSDISLSGVDSNEKSEGATSIEAHHKHIKDLFSDLIDAQSKVHFSFVAFTWNEPNDCQLTIKAVMPNTTKE